MAAKKKSMTPAVRYLRYELTNSAEAGTETSHFIDLAKDLSAVNRRLYRQGRKYHVKRITIVSSNTPNADNRVSFSVAGDAWVTNRAWRRGFDVWNKMNKRAMENAGSDFKPTWHDYKVYLSNDMRTGTILGPLDNGGNASSGGEWTYSEYISPDGTTSADTFTAGLLGPQNGVAGSVVYLGLVESYSHSRASVFGSSPSVDGSTSDDPLMNLFDDGTVHDEILNNLESDNDAPPYPVTDYPGGGTELPKPQVVQDTTIMDGKATVGGFTAMCGLIEIEAKSPIANDVYSILVELAPGSYRGIGADVIE